MRSATNVGLSFHPKVLDGLEVMALCRPVSSTPNQENHLFLDLAREVQYVEKGIGPLQTVFKEVETHYYLKYHCFLWFKHLLKRGCTNCFDQCSVSFDKKCRNIRLSLYLQFELIHHHRQLFQKYVIFSFFKISRSCWTILL